jgi:alpha-galactosidase
MKIRLPLTLVLSLLAWLPGHADATPPASSASVMSLESWNAKLPFSFIYAGKDSSTFLASWQRTEKTAPSPGGQLHRYTFSDPATKLKVVAEVRTFTGYPAVDWVLKFTNEGATDTPIIEKIEPLNWTCTPGSTACVIHHARGSNSQVNDFEPLTETLNPGGDVTLGAVNGRSSDTNTLPFFNLQMGDKGVIGAIGWTGNWNALFHFDKATGNLTTTAGMQATHFLLHPGETVRTPRILLLNWTGGDWQAAQNIWRRLALAYYSPLDPARQTISVPFCLGTWGAESIDAKLTWVRNLHDKKVPFDVYWIDAGWYGNEVPMPDGTPNMGVGWFQNRGTWTPNATTYPHGFAPLGDALKAAGYGFLLWFEAETADPGSTLRTEHPGWFLEIPNPPNQGTALLNLGNPEARQGITDLVSDMITTAGLTWYRQDFNMPADGFWARADAPDRVGITEIKHITGLYQFWDDLRARHPGLQIDNCSSGGRRLDLETMSRSVSLWRTDYECGFFDPIGGQLETQGLASWVPLNAGCYGGVTPGAPNAGAALVYAMRSNYSAGLVLNPGDRGPQGDLSIDLMKTVGDEFLEVRPYFSGNFYPLQNYSSGADAWCIWQFDRPDLKAGVVMVFRRQNSGVASLRPDLHAIDPQATYDVEIRTGFEKVPVQSMSGHDLASLEIAIPAKPGSALVFYRKR